MSWKDEYLDASFRDVPFYVRSSRVSGGRRLATHEYPRRNDIEHEDLGAADTSFSFQAVVIGEDYFDARDKLEATFVEGTAGVLVHPYRGALNVVVDRYTLSETFDRGGAAFFSVTFLLEPEETVTVRPDTAQQVELARQELDTAVAEWFEESYDTDNKPVSVLDDAQETLSKSFVALDAAKRAAATSAEFKRDLANAVGQVIALRVNAGAIAFTFKNLVNFGVDAVDVVSDLFSPKDQLREQRQLLSTTTSPLVETSEDIASDDTYPSKQIQNLTALNVVSSSSSLITQAEFGSVDEATEEQNYLFDAIDTLVDNESLSDNVISALRDVRKTVFDYVQEEATKLPLVVTVRSAQMTNTLTLSYEQYGTLDEAADIADRNKLVHPGFVPKATDIQLRVFNE